MSGSSPTIFLYSLTLHYCFHTLQTLKPNSKNQQTRKTKIGRIENRLASLKISKFSFQSLILRSTWSTCRSRLSTWRSATRPPTTTDTSIRPPSSALDPDPRGIHARYNPFKWQAYSFGTLCISDVET